MIRLGGPVFTDWQDPDAWARAHVDWGYRAAYCPKLPPDQADRIDEIARSCQKHDIVLAELGVWVNLIDPDQRQRRANLDQMARSLALADRAGVKCCVTFAGTRESGQPWGPCRENFSPETFERIVRTLRDLLEDVQPRRTRLALEMMQTCPPDSAENYLEIIRAVDHPAMGVHLDPVNILMTPRDAACNGPVLRSCIETLGPWIASCHAKDLRVEPGLALHINECPPGTGWLDYRAYLQALAGLGRDVPLMLEHLPGPETYARARDYIAALL